MLVQAFDTVDENDKNHSVRFWNLRALTQRIGARVLGGENNYHPVNKSIQVGPHGSDTMNLILPDFSQKNDTVLAFSAESDNEKMAGFARVKKDDVIGSRGDKGLIWIPLSE